MSTSFRNLYESNTLKKYITSKDSPTREATSYNFRDRLLIIGGSGSGKTHALLQLLLLSEDTFSKMIVCSLGIQEPIYDMLRDKLKEKIIFYTLDKMPNMNKLIQLHVDDPEDEILLVWDDLINSMQDCKMMYDYMVAGRKKQLSQVVISQCFFRTPKTIRLQQTHLIILKLSSQRDLAMILKDYTLGVTKEQMSQMYQEATADRLNFLLIDINSTNPNRKFSHNFGGWFHVEEEGLGKTRPSMKKLSHEEETQIPTNQQQQNATRVTRVRKAA
jgi:hypothetical protein